MLRITAISSSLTTSLNLFRCAHRSPSLRRYATVSPSIINNIGQPPSPPSGPALGDVSRAVPSQLDDKLLSSLSLDQVSLGDLIQQYVDRSGRVLDASLVYESRPTGTRKVNYHSADKVGEEGLVLVAHCIKDKSSGEHKVTVSSGFALEVPALNGKKESLVVTCAHTLEEIRRSPLALKQHSVLSGTFAVAGDGELHPVHSVSSALPRSDILLLTCDKLPVRTLPISPYPAHPQTPIWAHLVAYDKRDNDSGWSPWVGGTWRRWTRGEVKGYRDFAGRESQPGTYDALSHMLFAPLPTPGSSGGPIVDEESGAVVGISLGTRMDNRIEGIRGWGVPSECIFEMFSLPGLEGKK